VKGKKFLAINENGRVPALQDLNTRVVSWESGAVMNYVLRNYDRKNVLGPHGDSEQAHVDLEKWILFLLTGLGPMMGQLNWYRHYNEQKNEDAIQRYEGQVYRHFDVLEGQLAKSGGKFILPEGLSAADAHFWPWINEYEFADVKLDKYPNIKKWYGEIGEMKEVKNAYMRIQEAK
jgi:glutathione S-transferase